MRCPMCDYPHSKVVMTKPEKATKKLIRRRACKACDHRWYTIQELEQCISGYQLQWKRCGKVETVEYAP